jgi:hypothetical protein
MDGTTTAAGENIYKFHFCMGVVALCGTALDSNTGFEGFFVGLLNHPMEYERAI